MRVETHNNIAVIRMRDKNYKRRGVTLLSLHVQAQRKFLLPELKNFFTGIGYHCVYLFIYLFIYDEWVRQIL